MQDHLPDRAELCQTFEGAGFGLIAEDVIVQTIASSWQAYADKLAAGGDSVLAQLSRQEMEQGLAALRHHGTTSTDQGIAEPVDLFVFR
jgi:hypothetical protein